MRAAFLSTLKRLADRDDRVMLLTGDLGFMVVEAFADAHPSRFVNVGVAEANMLGLATGLASQGYIPFCYSIATFASMRGYEQLRNGPVLHELPVRVVGVGGGFAYGSAGFTHHALEDVGLARLQPGLRVIAPADDAQAAAALESTYDAPGPTYYRLGKDRTVLPELGGRFGEGRLELIGEGRDILFITYGGMAATAVAVARELQSQGVGTTVAVAACIAPPPLEDLYEQLTRTHVAMTVEDHYLTGGLGALVAEVMADRRIDTRLVRRGVTAPLRGRSGSETYLRSRAGLAHDDLVRAAHAALEWALVG